MALVEVRELRKAYRVGPVAVEALRGVSLDLEPGEVVALVGASGSGKTTLLHLLAGLDRPDGGSIRFLGRDLATMSREELARHRREGVGMVFQAFHLLPTFTARRNVEIALAVGGVPRGERRGRAAGLLDAVGLAARGDHRPSQLSGGEQQRVAIARALANGPRVLLADEPTGNLDSRTAEEVLSLLVRPAREGKAAVLVVTHNEPLLATVATRILRIRDGALVGEGATGSAAA
ncbi:MAG: ABC transporter ATP-binding protein [Planctomycetales bacterium]|nr:ABC transporter ATP-binding protein [Planctomycetales bacterium]